MDQQGDAPAAAAVAAIAATTAAAASEADCVMDTTPMPPQPSAASPPEAGAAPAPVSAESGMSDHTLPSLTAEAGASVMADTPSNLAQSMTPSPPAPSEPVSIAHSHPHPHPTTASVPLSDLEVAAQYANLEIQSVATDLADASMALAPVPTTGSADAASDESSESDGEVESELMADAGAGSGDESSSDEDEAGEDSKYSTATLRAEIEAAMESGDAQAGEPLKTANEVVSPPVRVPAVELTADCPIAECGSILNRSTPGLMVTVKSLLNGKPLDEGSVLCLEDRTVLGCVDEVFGPVLMPMYLVRFEAADKMPERAAVGARVFHATEHTTYIVPEEIKDKGTDASNLFDEETDEAVYSDDEAEAAAKRQNRKRNRGGAPAATATVGAATAAAARWNGRQQVPPPPSGRSNYARTNAADYRPDAQSLAYSGGVAYQVQPFGGQTNYTTGPVSFGQPPRAAPMAYGPTNYTAPGGFAPPPSSAAQYSQTPTYHHPTHGVPSAAAYHAPPAYHASYAPPPSRPPQAPYMPAPHQYAAPPQPNVGYPPPPMNLPYQHGMAAPPARRGPPQAAYSPNSAQPPLPRDGHQERRY